MLTIRRETFEGIVIDGLKEGMIDPELFKVFAEEYYAEANRSRIDRRAARASIEREQSRIKKRIRRILDRARE